MKNSTLTPVRPALKKTRAIKDCASGNWSYEFEFKQTDGKSGHVIVAGDDASNPHSLLRHLNNKGAQLPRAADEGKLILESAIDSKPEQIEYQLASAGWQLRKGKSPWFCIGQRMVGAPEGKVVYLPPRFINLSKAKNFTERGTLDQ
jgi:hypothetical protein